MIYELRTYTFHQGKAPAYVDLVRTVGRPVRGDEYGKCHGYWVHEFGDLNQVSHLWSYPSLDERTRLRAGLSQNERWAKEFSSQVRPLLQRQEIRLLNPVKDVTPPEQTGGVYELRTYRANPGGALGYAELLKSYFPVREKYSKNVGLWTCEAPHPNDLVHLWNYPDLNARAKARAGVAADPGWKEFLSKGAGRLAAMNSVILLPTDFSPLR
jgi:hypothetical protein